MSYDPFTGPTPQHVMDGPITRRPHWSAKEKYVLDRMEFDMRTVAPEEGYTQPWGLCPSRHMDCTEHGRG